MASTTTESLLLPNNNCRPVVVSHHLQQRRQPTHEKSPRIRGVTPLLFLATSSKELKHQLNSDGGRDDASNNSISSRRQNNKVPNNKSGKPPLKKAPIAQRLSMAAKQASKRREERERQERKSNKIKQNSLDTKHHDDDEEEDDAGESATTTPLASLQQLTNVIDRKLLASQSSPDQWNRDSMTAVVRHNEQQEELSRAATPIVASTQKYREVAIVLAKPLMQDHITVEYANRIRRLVRAMMTPRGTSPTVPESSHNSTENDKETIPQRDDETRDTDDSCYKPDVICFVGAQSRGNILAGSDAGYMYFQFLTAAYGVSTTGIDIHLVQGSIDDGALQQIAFFLQETCLPAWLRLDRQQKKRVQQQQQEMLDLENQATTIINVTSGSFLSNRSSLLSTSTSNKIKQQQQRDRLKVHFSLISSEYELCQLNDIHIRSPGQSVLRALESWSQRSFSTSWSYMYVTTVSSAKDAAQAFCAKTYKTAQQLLPVIQNLRNVVNNCEFFQTESYRVLVATRRSLVSDMESLYVHQPQLRAVHNHRSSGSSRNSGVTGNSNNNNARPVDVALESALLLLGRCVDIVRPAGLLTGSPVSQSDWKLALVVLKQAYDTIQLACDPDEPLDPKEWMSLGDEYEEETDGSLQ